jgi:hypothetical protein
MANLFLLAFSRSDVHEISTSPHYCSKTVLQACQNETSGMYKYLVFMRFVQSEFFPHRKAAQIVTDHIPFHQNKDGS